MACKMGCPILDLNRAMLSEADYDRMLQEDGLHFTETGYDFLARLIIKKVEQID
ncbi:hypothetical protein QS257_06930 [Terrilactibacillus sp. S3-3]|nr:hypothetical protein QS257_06930 [Terrilactibacillus sp. S3-3]